MKFIGIIPARYASTRFPGKPLADLCGRTVIHRVYDQVSQVLDTVVVATDDDRIYDHVEAFGGKVVMTRADHACGTDRCLEAYHHITTPMYREQNEENIVIINIQGDEPFIQPSQIEAIMGCFENPTTDIATLVKPFTEKDGLEALENPNSPKVVMAPDGTALLFSRSVIPYMRNIEKSEWLKERKHFKHIGMYAYKAKVLEKITQLKQTPMEQMEQLEQLRWLENGYKIRVATCNVETIGIDTPADLEAAIQKIRNNKQ